MKLIINGRLVTSNNVIDDSWLAFNDRIIEIGQGQPSKGILAEQIIDAHQQLIIPGMIDIHVHGGNAYSVMDASEIALEKISQHLAAHGVTAYLPTTMTKSWPEIKKALKNVKSHMNISNKYAQIIGVHLEGPFINVKKRGAQMEAAIARPDFAHIEQFLDLIKIITYAPETDTCQTFATQMKDAAPDTVLSAGHTMATYEQGCAAISNGLRSATHIFNGMNAMHHRQPGITAALLEKPIYCELIADNIHVHPAWQRLLLKLKGPEKIILISDAIRATGCSDGFYDVGGQQVAVQQGQARLLHNGALAGSTLTLDKAVLNFKNNTKIDWPDVIKMVSLNPAKLLKIETHIGSLEQGKIANIVICDEEMNIMQTIINGDVVL